MTDQSFHISELSDLPRIAQQFVNEMKGKKVFAFDAQMGTGKTTFINSILNAMGIEQTEGSPTYSIVNVYDSPAFGKIYHFDVYRLKNEHEALDFGMEEMLYGGGICLIEWPENISNLLPPNSTKIEMNKNQNGTRTLNIVF